MEKPSLSIPTIETIDGKSSVKFVDKTYPEFIKDNTQTNLRSVDLGDGNYSYTVQRNIIFDTPKVEKVKSQESPKVVNAIITKQTSDIESKVNEIKSLDKRVFVHGVLDGYTTQYMQSSQRDQIESDLESKLYSRDIRIKMLSDSEKNAGGVVHDIYKNNDGKLIYNSGYSREDATGRRGGFFAFGVSVDSSSKLSEGEIFSILDKKLENAVAAGLFDQFGSFSMDDAYKILRSNRDYKESPGIVNITSEFADLEKSEVEPVEAKPQQQRRGNGKSIERKKPLSDEDLMPNFSGSIEESTGFEIKNKSTNLQTDFITYAKSQSPEIKRSLIAMNRNKEIEVKCK